MNPRYILWTLRAIIPAYLLVALATAQPFSKDARDFLTQWEGYTTHVVTRSNGERVVGVGHNMRYPAPLIDGKEQYSAKELNAAFTHDLAVALETARAQVTGYDALPHDVKLVTLSVIWTVGATGFREFRDYKAAIARRDYSGAAQALVDSQWAKQVGMRRVENHAAALRKAAR